MVHPAPPVIQRSDFDEAVQLLIEALQRLDQETVRELGAFR